MNGALRRYPSMDVYRSWGSPDLISVSSEDIENCFQRGPPLDPKQKETPSPDQPTTVTPAFSNTVYAIIHAGSYMENGELHVLTATFGNVYLSKYTMKNETQAWVITPDGEYLRNLAGNGMYLAGEEGCLAPMLQNAAYASGQWTIQPTGSREYEYTIVSKKCGNTLTGDGTSKTVSMVSGVGGEAGDTLWFVVPVGSMQTR
jgi:hypothetical protein